MAEEFSAGFWLSPQQRLAYRIQAPDAACLLTLTGAVDADRIRKAVEQIASRHEILRTVFRRQTGMKLPFQVVLDRMDLTWREADLTTLDQVARDKAMESLWNDAIAGGGSAEQQPGLKAVFIKLADNRCALILTASALCCDAKSLELIVRELALIYAGAVSSLSEPFRYAQFAQWQEDLFQSADDDAKKAKSFWSKQLESFSRLALPNENATDKTRPFAPAVVCVPLAEPQAAAVLQQKPAFLLLSAWACVLHRLSGQSALALGYLLDNREYEELEHALGCFARTVPLALKIESHFGFSDVTKQSASAVADAIGWQEYFSPETIGVDGDLVAFAYQELIPTQKPADVEFSLARVRAVSERYKLRLVALRRGSELVLEFQYDPACFSRSAVERIAGNYQNVLAAALARPETPVSHLPLLSDAERRQLVVDWNRTAAEYPRTACLQELFEQQ
ncbi:MAG TPA: condensation domain-containing protein, partial [Terriglobales bacterium]